MDTMNLAEAYPKEQARLREMIEQYRAIGPAGTFGLAVIQDVLARSEKAAAGQDTVTMIRCYQEMQGCK